MSEDRGQPPFRLSSLTAGIFLPTILFAIGQGAIIPAIPLFARELGSTVAAAALVVALRGIGQLAFDMPAGIAVSKFGDKWAMVAGAVVIGVVAIGAALSPTPIVLGVFVFFMGGAWTFWTIARLSFMSLEVPLENRGRALSMTGGMNRIGNFLGPVIGGFLAESLGHEAAFGLQSLMGFAAAACLLAGVRPGVPVPDVTVHAMGGRILDALVDNRRLFAAVGLPIISLGLMRQARQVFLPLWGSEELLLSDSQIGLIVGASFLIDSLIFYPVGLVMDTHGRKWAMIPCLVTLGIGLAVLPLTGSFEGFLVIGLITGLGNGFGSGINMTLGADFAPHDTRGEFLGAWRLVSDLGQAGGPLVVSGLTGVASLAVAAVASGGFGLAGGIVMLLFVPETLRRGHRAVFPVTVVPPPE